MVEFSSLNTKQKLIEGVRWIGVLPAASFGADLALMCGLSWLSYLPYVVAGAFMAPRFRTATSVALVAIVVARTLPIYLGTPFLLRHYASAAAGILVVTSVDRLLLNRWHVTSNDAARLALTLAALVGMVAVSAVFRSRVKEVRAQLDNYHTNPVVLQSNSDAYLRGLTHRLNEYHTKFGEYPTTEQGLAQLSQMWDGVPYRPTDSWDSPIRYERLHAHKIRVSSSGPDRVAGTEDDTVMTRVFGSDPVIEVSNSRRQALERLRRHMAAGASDRE